MITPINHLTSLFYLLLISPLYIHALSPELHVDLTPIDNYSPSERFLQNDDLFECPFNRTCTGEMPVSQSFSFIIDHYAEMRMNLPLRNRPQADLKFTYSSNSTDVQNVEPVIYLADGFQTTTRVDPPQESSWEVVISKSQVRSYRNGKAYVYITNESGEPIIITMKAAFGTYTSSNSSSNSSSNTSSNSSSSSSSNSTTNASSKTSSSNINSKLSLQQTDASIRSISFLGILLPVAGTLLFMIFMGVWCHYYRKRRQQRFLAAMQRMHMARGQQPGQEAEDYLTEENLNERFPEAKYEEFKSPFAQTICSICLDEFKQGVSCRQLYCEHLFHAECIRLWLVGQLQKGHASCPNCNKDMIRKNSQAEYIHLQIE